jgi:hypothetical protein
LVCIRAIFSLALEGKAKIKKKSTVFYVVMPYGSVKVYRRFREIYCFNFQIQNASQTLNNQKPNSNWCSQLLLASLWLLSWLTLLP